MAMTSVNIPAELLDRAMETLGARTKREAIVGALEEIVRRGQQERAVDALLTFPRLADMVDPEVKARARR